MSARLQAEFGPIMPLPGAYSLMQHLKATLDPRGVFHAPFYTMI
jgi:FAD/FMN-containing dehydrogenase